MWEAETSNPLKFSKEPFDPNFKLQLEVEASALLQPTINLGSKVNPNFN